MAKQKFCLHECDRKYLDMVFNRLKALSQMTRLELLALPNTGKSWRFHRITWADVSEPGFDLPNELTADDNAYQFMISKANGRVHGFLLGATFFVRWLDPQHNLYHKKSD